MNKLLGATLMSIMSLGCGDGSQGPGADNPSEAGGNSALGGTTSGAGGGSHAGGAGGVATGTGGSRGTGGALGTGGAASGVGGAAGTGGAVLGSGGSSAADAGHVIGACDGLGAAGVWEEISPIPGDDPGLMTADWLKTGQGTKWGGVALAVHPNRSGTVYVSVPHGGIWKSTNCGASFTKTNTGTNGAVIDSGIQFVLRLAPGVTDTLYACNWQGSNLAGFKSTNGGVDWAPLYGSDSVVVKDVELGGWVNDIRLDPGDDQHLLINFHANCKAPYNGGCIGESKDAGGTWRLVNGPLDAWSEGSSVYFVTTTTWLFGSHAGLFYTSDNGATWMKVAQSANIGGLVRSPAGTYYLGSDQNILQSQDGKAWSVIANSPPAIALLGTGTTLYSGDFLSISGPTPNVVSSAPESNPTTWTRVTTPTMSSLGGPWDLGYDADHHVLYSANKSSGFWRAVLP
jgi:hypothetical protein